MQAVKKDLSDGLFHAKLRFEIFLDEHPRFAPLVRYGALLLLAIWVGMFLTEYPINPRHWFGYIDPYHFALSTLLMGTLFFVIYLVGQRLRGSVVLYWVLCMVLGLANHYVLLFKGAPVIPSDLLALGTAAEVAGGYDYTPDATVITTVVVFALAVFVLFKFVRPLACSLRRGVVNLVMAAALAFGCGFVFMNVEVADATDTHIYAWHPERTMKAKGTWLCDFVMAQALVVKAPAGYSHANAQEILDDAAAHTASRGVTVMDDDGDVLETGAATDTAGMVKPNVICVMNETFADLSIYDEMEGQEAATLPNYAKIAKESIVSGYSYVSVYGAGTCNSEFEFLTGSTLEFCGNGAYPYEFYDLSDSGNLAEYFNSLGYESSAIHPSEASNWSRDVVYPQMGFDKFITIEQFKNPEMLRNKTTDRESYKTALDLVRNSDDPQFIFDVTYMNHSGYATGMLPRDMMVDVKCNGQRQTNLTEYLSIIQESDRQLNYLIDQLRELDEPTIVVMFGDHGPNFINDYFFEDDTLTGSERVGEAMKRYTTPYFVWANYDVEAPEMTTTEAARNSRLGSTQGSTGKVIDNGNPDMNNMSLNYLGITLVECAGLPMTEYQSFIADSRSVMPVLNYIGYMDATGTWHNHQEAIDESSTKEAQDAAAQIGLYETIQYWNLFDRSGSTK